MTYKLLAIDMDGTLLSNNKEISLKNIEALKKAQKSGIEIVIATGRPYATVKSYVKQMGVPCWLATNNGSVIRNKEGEVISVTYIQQSSLIKVVELLEAGGVYYHGSDTHYTYIKNLQERVRVMKRFIARKGGNPMEGYLKALWIVLFSNTHRKVNMLQFVRSGGKMTSILVLCKDEEKLRQLRALLEEIEGIDVTSSGRDNIEILDRRGTKGHALEKLSKALNIDPMEMVAVGDNYNDLTMIEFAGLGVAMGNGEEDIKKRANWITKTNEEDGIAFLVNKILGKTSEEIV